MIKLDQNVKYRIKTLCKGFFGRKSSFKFKSKKYLKVTYYDKTGSERKIPNKNTL